MKSLQPDSAGHAMQCGIPELAIKSTRKINSTEEKNEGAQPSPPLGLTAEPASESRYSTSPSKTPLPSHGSPLTSPPEPWAEWLLPQITNRHSCHHPGWS